MSGIGHNGGPTMEAGYAWRRHAWGAAREALLPHLPLEVLRGRLKRAAELGLDYRTYASVRAASGQDVVAVLFSSNALQALQGAPLPGPRIARLRAVEGAGRIGLATRPLTPQALAEAAEGALDAAHEAPAALARWRDARAALRAALGRLPADRTLLVGAFALERDWCAAGGLAGYVPAERYFGA